MYKLDFDKRIGLVSNLLNKPFDKYTKIDLTASNQPTAAITIFL